MGRLPREAPEVLRSEHLRKDAGQSAAEVEFRPPAGAVLILITRHELEPWTEADPFLSGSDVMHAVGLSMHDLGISLRAEAMMSTALCLMGSALCLMGSLPAL